ncbi:hypothetical protein EJ06DRAFT_251772 [Trichodelitschia bisporula]|uniref:Uncharacterized protein n=1 Tax=Trichodelitschia bisporula TaxID=703511 RepID=A0A6G1HJE2_9PEZI|nr:hypothetical protein EJ06DRAFT_251772 [Trichodelitschia bisporula]
MAPLEWCIRPFADPSESAEPRCQAQPPCGGSSSVTPKGSESQSLQEPMDQANCKGPTLAASNCELERAPEEKDVEEKNGEGEVYAVTEHFKTHSKAQTTGTATLCNLSHQHLVRMERCKATSSTSSIPLGTGPSVL